MIAESYSYTDYGPGEEVLPEWNNLPPFALRKYWFVGGFEEYLAGGPSVEARSDPMV